MRLTIIKGTIVSVPSPGRTDVTEHGYLIAENGRIIGVYPKLPACYHGAPVEDFTDDLILQAPMDMHFHAPQYPMLGNGQSLPLLDWLQLYTFPTEARFADIHYAREIYHRLAHELVENGTTRVCAFSSLHRPATLVLMDELERAGISGYVGKVNMDRVGLPGVLDESAEQSKRETLLWLEQSAGFSRVRPILTPRFAPGCSPGLLDFLGELSRKYDLPVQTHLSETRSEWEWVRKLRPECGQSRAAYEKAGLWHDRALMAHCVWSDAEERHAMVRDGVICVHCASSNQNLCSGTASIRRMINEGVRVALGSDIAGGSSLSMFDAAADTIRTSKTRHLTDGWAAPFLNASEAWYLATGAGAVFFGDQPGFIPGNSLHALALRDRDLLSPRPLTPVERLERCIFLRQRDAVRAVWADGHKIFSRE